jgi:hypothetical protein
MSKRDYVTEILQKRQRTAPVTRRWELVSERINDLGRIPDVIHLLEELEDVSGLEDLEDYIAIQSAHDKVKHSFSLTWEIARYIPIGLVACMEGYFRQVYADLINHGSPYKANASKFTDIKFSIEIAISLENHSLSIGDFVAHLLTTNNLEDINKNISTLIGDDFLEKLKAARQSAIPHSYEFRLDSNNEVYIGEPDYNQINSYMIKSVKRMFELRHMFCHEIDPRMSREDFYSILKYPEIALEFLLISEFAVDILLSQS